MNECCHECCQWLIHFSSSLCVSVPQQTSCRLFTFIAITYLFRSLADGNCFYSAASVSLVGNNLLIYTLITLTSIELFLNCEFYSKHPVLIDVYNNVRHWMAKNFLHYLILRLNQPEGFYLLKQETKIKIWLSLLKMRPN